MTGLTCPEHILCTVLLSTALMALAEAEVASGRSSISSIEAPGVKWSNDVKCEMRHKLQLKFCVKLRATFVCREVQLLHNKDKVGVIRKSQLLAKWSKLWK